MFKYILLIIGIVVGFLFFLYSNDVQIIQTSQEQEQTSEKIIQKQAAKITADTEVEDTIKALERFNKN